MNDAYQDIQKIQQWLNRYSIEFYALSASVLFFVVYLYSASIGAWLQNHYNTPQFDLAGLAKQLSLAHVFLGAMRVCYQQAKKKSRSWWVRGALYSLMILGFVEYLTEYTLAFSSLSEGDQHTFSDLLKLSHLGILSTCILGLLAIVALYQYKQEKR